MTMSASDVKVGEAKVSDKDTLPSKNIILKESSGWDTIGRLSTLKRNLKTLSSHSIKKQDECKDKNEPSRFMGEGVSYKAKLIGILEVSDPRGDRMCQEALADLKMAIRAAGEHKQRITINIAIDGLRLRDDKTGDCLYHHPVHKISFIAQDMSDSRAFGYIFGSPDTGHRFFGIKTDKAASQVVISMRDLFQVVYDLKKQEIETAKQHIEQHQKKYGMGLYGDSPPPKTSADTASASSKLRPITEDSSKDNASKPSAPSEAIADLLDLEFELNNIQQGLNQMERITPSDPFGDSFAPPTSAKLAPAPTKTTPSPSQSVETPPPSSTVPPKEQHWFDRETEALFDDGELPTSPQSAPSITPAPSIKAGTKEEEVGNLSKDQFDVFTDLDPLGTGKIKPYIDKKDFFQELKNPPKKVLKDLVGEAPNDNNPPLFQANFENGLETSDNKPKESLFPSTTDPFGDDPFDKTDPFVDRDFSHSVGFSVVPSMNSDPFDTGFADFTNFSEHSDFSTTSSFETPIRKSPQPSEGSPSVHGPLRVSLPPEKHSDSVDYGSPKLSPSPPTSRNRSKYSRLHKQTTLSGLVKLPSPKQKARSRLSKQNTLDSCYDRNSPVMEGVILKNRGIGTPSPPTISFLGDLAPEPPPRPTVTNTLIKPPPLPPKRQLQSAIMKPPPRPPHTDEHPHYDYIENCETSIEISSDVKSPPIPVPARRPRFGGDESSAPHRPSKNLPSHTEPEYYLTPFPLLPPPQKKTASPKSSVSRDSSVSPRPVASNTVSSLDITLSQLSKTGFSDLAATLNMSPTSLSKMTLQELTKCLQTLSEVQKNNPSTDEFIEDRGKLRKNVLKSEQYSALRESLDEETPPFKAEFESHFDLNVDKKPIDQTKEEESLFDKYAVFRELLEQEKTIFDNSPINSNFEDCLASVKSDNELVVEPSDEIKSTDSTNKEVTISEPLSKPTEDRYAALRDICLDDLAVSKESDKEETEALSDRDDSIAEVTRCEDELDTLTLSRPHSESTDSPTATIKETQSIMESTILEEDASALDDDEGPDEAIGDLGSMLPTVAESNESIAASDSPIQNVPHKELSVSSLQSIKGDEFVNNSKEKEVDFNSLVEGWAKFDNGPTEADKSGSIHSEGNISPWSVDSKDTPKESHSPAWRDHPERKSRKGRRHKAPTSDWQEDDESEEGCYNRRSRNTSWEEPPWRENGWSDGDSMYDDTPPYDFKHHPQFHTQRRGRRRKVSPWRKSSRDPSPWEEDDRDLSEDQWEGKRWEDSSWQTRPKHRGSSWEEERRRDDLRRDDPRRDESRRDDSRRDDSRREDSRREDSRRDDARREDSRRDDARRDDSRKRRPSPWSTEGERRSSRESLNWEDDERYSRRNYRDRRRRRWEDTNYSRRDWRDREQGRRNYSYYRDRSHESPWEDEFSEQGDEDSPRCQSRKQMWSRSRNSEDEQYDRRYIRPSSREEQIIPDTEAHWARKSQTLQTRSRMNKSKKRSQNSPFEDDFSAQNFVFTSDKSPGAGSDFSDHGSKTVQVKPQSSPDEVFKRKELFSDSVDFSPQDCKVITPRSRQSPFEDDFTPPEIRRTNGRNNSSDISEKRLQIEEQKMSDDVFSGDSCSDVISRPRISKLDKNVLELSISKRKGKSNISDPKIGKPKTESEILCEDFASKRSSDKKQGPELKRVSNLRKNESSSFKTESINIFTRSGDPFDDDFFSTDASSCTFPKNKEDKSKKSDPFKWAEAFSAFNFDEEAK